MLEANNFSDSAMKVSVAMITYNHEEFIAKALDSILMQRTNFDYEIVIGEDCSTDNTRNIIMDYQTKYPDKFRLFLNEKNLGMHRNGVQVHHACKGKYIALLEGDDYWTSPEKLQKQVDFLDNHPECAICFHNVTELYKDGSREAHSFCRGNRKEFSTVEDLLVTNFIPTPSTMFRNGLVTEFPEWWFSLLMGDWPLHILNALHGKIGYINEVMAVHVNHSAGVWFKMMQNWQEQSKASIEVYDYFYTYLEPKYRKIIRRILHNRYLYIAEIYENMGDSTNARSYAIRSFTKHFVISRKLLKILLRLYVPILYKLLRSLKRTIHLIIGNTAKICGRLQPLKKILKKAIGL